MLDAHKKDATQTNGMTIFSDAAETRKKPRNRRQICLRLHQNHIRLPIWSKSLQQPDTPPPRKYQNNHIKQKEAALTHVNAEFQASWLMISPFLLRPFLLFFDISTETRRLRC